MGGSGDVVGGLFTHFVGWFQLPRALTCNFSTGSQENMNSSLSGNGGSTTMAAENEDSCGIRVTGMQFSYDVQQPPLFLDFNLNVSPGSRCLLVGANGSGNAYRYCCFYHVTRVRNFVCEVSFSLIAFVQERRLC